MQRNQLVLDNVLGPTSLLSSLTKKQKRTKKKREKKEPSSPRAPLLRVQPRYKEQSDEDMDGRRSADEENAPNSGTKSVAEQQTVYVFDTAECGRNHRRPRIWQARVLSQAEPEFDENAWNLSFPGRKNTYVYRVSEIHSSKREAEEVLKKLPGFQDAPDPKRTPTRKRGRKR